jgi:hypothetical protein
MHGHTIIKGYDSWWKVTNYWKETAASLFRAVLKIQNFTV